MQVHRCQFVDYVPKPINAIECAPATSTTLLPYVAVGRANGDIELWRRRGNMIHEKTIPGMAQNGSLETLAWSHQTQLTEDDLELFTTPKEQAAARKRLAERAPRLFSAGLNAVIIEWDLAKLVPKAAVDSYGGAVWCMATNHAQTQLAVGTEDGHIRLFDISDDGVEYLCCFDKVNSRILAVAWSQGDKSIVTGSADGCVRIWDTQTRSLKTRMTLPKQGRDHTLVWAVKVLRDNTIVSGDSRGKVTFWNLVMNVKEHEFRALGADVLCLAVDESGQTVFASGVDPKITQFKLLASNTTGEAEDKKKVSKKWQIAGFRRYHTHGVRAIVVSAGETPKDDLLISGGADTQVAYCASGGFPNENPHRQPCFPPLNSAISIATEAKLVLQRQDSMLKLWSLGQAEPVSKTLGEQMESGQSLQVFQRQRDLLQMELTTKTNIICSAISPKGNLVLASDSEGPRLYSVVQVGDTDNTVKVKRIREFPPLDFVPEYSEQRGVVQAHFSADETRMVVATADGFVSVVDISSWQNSKDRRFTTIRRHCGHRFAKSEVELDSECNDGVPTHAAQVRKQPDSVVHTRTITSMAVSHDEKWTATCDSTGLVVASENESDSLLVVPPLGVAPGDWPTALSFDSQNNLVLPTNTNRIYVFDVRAGQFTEWTQRYAMDHIPSRYNGLIDCVAGVTVNPAEPECVYAWAVNHITRIDLTQPPGPKRAVLNIHKRKQIEHKIIEQVVGEKEEADRRLIKHSKKRKGNHRATDSISSSTSSLATLEEGGGKDWETTVVARLREAGINVEETHNFRMTQRYQALMHASFVDANTMVIVVRPWIDVAATLPPAYHRHKYGA